MTVAAIVAVSLAVFICHGHQKGAILVAVLIFAVLGQIIRQQIIQHGHCRIQNTSGIPPQINDHTFHALFFQILDGFHKLLCGIVLKLAYGNIAQVIILHLVFHRLYLYLAPLHIHLYVITDAGPVHLQVHRGSFLAFHILAHQNIQVHVSRHFQVIDLVEHIAGHKACLFRRRILKHLYNGYHSSGHVFRHHSADSAVLSSGLFHQILKFLWSIISGIIIFQSRHQPLIDGLLHIFQILVKQEVFFDIRLQELALGYHPVPVDSRLSFFSLSGLTPGLAVNHASADEKNAGRHPYNN